MSAEQILSCIINIPINGADLILDRVFDNVEFNRIDDEVFRQLVKARLSYPASKAATVEYLKNHFYDVTTLYFESDYEDELRKTGFSKEGRHQNPQIILGLLVSIGGYPLAYCIHEGNKYEGHTMLPVVTEFSSDWFNYYLYNVTVIQDLFDLSAELIEVRASIFWNLLAYSLFHSAGFVFHIVKYVFHTVVFVSHSVKQRILSCVSKKRRWERVIYVDSMDLCLKNGSGVGYRDFPEAAEMAQKNGFKGYL